MQGVLIEPSPSNYKMLARNRPRALALNLAICNSDTAVHFVDARETSGVYEFMAPSFVKRWHRKVCASLTDFGHRSIKHRHLSPMSAASWQRQCCGWCCAEMTRRHFSSGSRIMQHGKLQGSRVYWPF